MKKLLTLLALCCLMVTGAWADGFVASTVANPKVYNLTNASNMTIASNLTYHGTDGSGNAAKGMFAFISTGETNKYKIYETISGKYVDLTTSATATCKSGTQLVSSADEAEVFTIVQSSTTGQYLISPTSISTTTYMNYYQGGNANKNGETVGFYTTGNGDAGSRWAFVEALPVKTVASASDLSTNNTWYQLTVRYKYMKYDANSQTYYDTYDARPDATDETSLFAFVGNETDGYKIVNKAAGNDKAMGAANANTDTRLKSVDFADARTFLFKKVSSSNAGTWQIYDKNDNAAYLNQQATNLGYWKGGGNGDDGNRFTFTEVEFGGEKDFKYVLTDVHGNTYEGTYKSTVSQAQPQLTGVYNYSLTNESWENVTDGSADILYKATINFPFNVSADGEDGHYTYIYSFQSTDYPWQADGTNVKVVKAATPDSNNFVWAIIPTLSNNAFTFKIKNVATGKYLYSTNSSNSHNAGIVTLNDTGSDLTYVNEKAFKLPNGMWLSLNSTSGGNGYTQYVGTYNSNHNGTKLIFTSLNKTPYTISADGKPDCVTVTIEGNEITGTWAQGIEYTASKQLSNSDVVVTTDDGYVATYAVDNNNHQINFDFNQIFVPVAHDGDLTAAKKYLIKNGDNYYIKYDNGNLPGTQTRSEADKYVFVKHATQKGKYYIYSVGAGKYLTYTATGNGSSTKVQTSSKVQLVASQADAKCWTFDNQICITPEDGGNAGLNFMGGADAGYVMNLYLNSDRNSKWQIIDGEKGSLACAMTMFSKPGAEYMHKLVPEEGVTVTSIELLDGLTGLTLKTDRQSKGNQYAYVHGTAPSKGVYHYNVCLSDGTKAPVTLTVSDFLQAPTPGMQWVSWNWFESNINAQKMTDIADGLKSKGLVDAGYKTIVLDDAWGTGSKDASNQWIPSTLTNNPSKFPDMASFVQTINGKGIRVGLYSDASKATCGGYQPGSIGVEAAHVAMFESWGIDFLKYDFCGGSNAPQSYKTMGDAIAALNATREAAGNRVPFVFNACEWGQNSPHLWGAESGTSMWRATSDARESWLGTEGRPGVLAGSDRVRTLWMYAGVNRFNDLDMMCIGLHGLGGPSNNTSTHQSNGGVITGLTVEQARSQMSIWSMLASPLSLSCDVRENPAADGNGSAGTLPNPLITQTDIDILTNEDILSISQDPLGQQAEYMASLGTANTKYQSTGVDVYVKDMAEGKMALAIVNRNDSGTATSQTISLNNIYLDGTKTYYVRDVWATSNKDFTVTDGQIVTGELAASQTKVYIISEEPFEEEVKPEFNIETESTVTSSQLLNGLTVTFTGANAADVQLSSTKNKAYLTPKETPAEAKAQNGKFKAAPTGAIEGNITATGETGKFSIAFPEADIVAGDYEVSIPAGTFYVGTTAHPVAELKANYTVEEAEPVVVDKICEKVNYKNIPVTGVPEPDSQWKAWEGEAPEIISDHCSSTDLYVIEKHYEFTEESNTLHVTFQHQGGQHRTDIVGVDVIAADGTTHYSDYHHGFTGGAKDANVYTINNIPEGVYTVRYIVTKHWEEAGKPTENNTQIKGYITNWDIPENGKVYTIYNDHAGTPYYLTSELKDGKTKVDNGAEVTATSSKWIVVGSAEDGYECYNVGTPTQKLTTNSATKFDFLEIYKNVGLTIVNHGGFNVQAGNSSGTMSGGVYTRSDLNGAKNALTNNASGWSTDFVFNFTGEYAYKVQTEEGQTVTYNDHTYNNGEYIITGGKLVDNTGITASPKSGATPTIAVSDGLVEVTYDSYDAPVTATYTLNPAAGTVEVSDLATITLAFTGDFEGVTSLTEEEMEDYVPSLTKGESEFAWIESMTMNDDGTVSISFDTSDITDGEWTLTIPEGTFTTLDANAQAAPVAEITATYTVASTPLTFDPEKLYTIYEPDQKRGYMAYNPDATGKVGLADVELASCTNKGHASSTDSRTGIAFKIIEEPAGTVKFYCEKNEKYVKFASITSQAHAEWTENATDATTFSFTKEGDNYLFKPTEATSDIYLSPSCGYSASDGPIILYAKEGTTDWQVTEYVAPEPVVVVPETGYYYIKESGKYLYNDFLNHSEATQSAATKQTFDNGYVWKVTSTEGSTTVTLLNGEGSGYNSTSPNSIDLSSKNWTFEAYSDRIITCGVYYDDMATYIPFDKGYAINSGNNSVAHNGGFFTINAGLMVHASDYTAYKGSDVIGQTAPDGTKWKDARIYDGLNVNVLSLYYYTEQDYERYLDVVKKTYEVFFKHIGEPGYCSEVDWDFEDPNLGVLMGIVEGFFFYDEEETPLEEYIQGMIEPYEAKYYLGFLNNYIKSLEIVPPVQGDAYHIAVRGNDYTGNTRYYLKNDGSYTDNVAEADVFVLGGSGDDTCGSLLVTNNNPGTEGGIHYLQVREDGVQMNTEYDEADNALNLVSMTKAEGDNIDSCPAYLYGTFSATNKDGKVLTFNETGEGSWINDADELYMKDNKTSAIELIPVEYPYNKPKFAVGSPDDHEGGYASIWLPYPMVFPEGVEAYRATSVENDGILILTQVNEGQNAVAAGGYILRTPEQTVDTNPYDVDNLPLVLPAPASPDDVTPYEDNAFVGSTENPLVVKEEGSWAAFREQHPNGTPYVLGRKNGIVGYYKYTDTKYLPKGKAIWFSNYTGNAECVQFSFDDIISAIEALHGNIGDNEIFDLQGRRLDKAEKGQVNVINGKKIMFK